MRKFHPLPDREVEGSNSTSNMMGIFCDQIQPSLTLKRAQWVDKTTDPDSSTKKDDVTLGGGGRDVRLSVDD